MARGTDGGKRGKDGHFRGWSTPVDPDGVIAQGEEATMGMACVGSSSASDDEDSDARVLAKVEEQSPTGSMKDRMALSVIDLAEEIVTVSTAEAVEMTRRLAREEAPVTETSSRATVAAALRVAGRLGPERTVVTLLCHSGLTCPSTDLYATDASRTGEV